MLRSMYSGVSGLRGHQTMMDVVGNNIANVNTAGFKASQAVFQDLLSQVLQGAGAAEGAGGTNPAQVGLGMRLAGTTTSFTQGGLQNTGRSTDLSIQGDGFFVLRSGAEQAYSRAGSFNFDAAGRLTSPQGGVVQGWLADANGVVNTNAAVGDITVPIGQLIDPSQTQAVDLGGNLPAESPVGTVLTSSIAVFDAQGQSVPLSFTYEKTGDNTWSITAEMPTATPPGTETFGPQSIVWDPATQTFDVTTMDITPTAAVGVFDADGFTVNLGATGEPLTQFAGLNTVTALGQDGAAVGALQSFAISADGVVTGVFSNGRTQALGQVALAAFNNPNGLEKVGGSLYRPTVNSGLAQIGTAGAGGRGVLAGGTLEMSNVDLAQEFTNLIVAQRGFQANSRVITTSDDLLQELVNLKR